MAVSRVSLSSITQGFPKSRSFLDGNSAYIPSSFESIATATGTGSSGTIIFSSIPSTYKHLQIRFVGKITDTGGDATMFLRFNNDATAGNYYRFHRLFGNGATATGASDGTGDLTGNWPILSSQTNSANAFGIGIIDILDYNGAKYKTWRSTDGFVANTTRQVNLRSGTWFSTSAITSFTLTASASTFFTTSSRFSLYGIKG